jgi:hypothetical protein
MALSKLGIKDLKQKFIYFNIAILLSIAFIVFNYSFKMDKKQSSAQIFNLDDDAQDMLKFFHEKNIFLTDIEKLKEIKMFRNSSHLELNFKKFLTISIPSFGVFYNDFENILEKVRKLKKKKIDSFYFLFFKGFKNKV